MPNWTDIKTAWFEISFLKKKNDRNYDSEQNVELRIENSPVTKLILMQIVHAINYRAQPSFHCLRKNGLILNYD